MPENWNGRLVNIGDGGKDGDLDFADERLAQGYAVAISDEANAIANAIRADLDEESEKPRAIPVADQLESVELFVSPICKGLCKWRHILTNSVGRS